jgi:hypothetical protein
MTDRLCASSNQFGTAPTHIVVVIPRCGRFIGRAGDRIPDIAPGRPPHHAVLTVIAARKAAWLLQFLRPSLRRAVTASLLSAMKTAVAEQRCANLVGATRLWPGIA